MKFNTDEFYKLELTTEQIKVIMLLCSQIRKIRENENILNRIFRKKKR